MIRQNGYKMFPKKMVRQNGDILDYIRLIQLFVNKGKFKFKIYI